MTSSPTQSPGETVAIVGVGLLGGSIALGAKSRGFVSRVIGIGRNRERLAAARDAGIVDEISTDFDAAAKASLTFVCTPVDRIARDVLQLLDIAPAMLITDVGSVKGAICQRLQDDNRARQSFVGSHPLAGSERQGWEAASADLFENRHCVVTPWDDSDPRAVERIVSFWERLGMQVHTVDATTHDRLLALTSHLPHAVAAALAALLSPEDDPFAATGFRDTTRIAMGDPGLWTPIFLQNRGAILAQIDEFAASLTALRDYLEREDTEGLTAFLTKAQANRTRLQ